MPGLTEAEEERLRKALGMIAEEAVAGEAVGAETVGAEAPGEEAPGEAGGRAAPSQRAPRVRPVRRVQRVRRVRRTLAVAVSAAAMAAFCFLAYTAIGGAETGGRAGGGAGDADADGKGLTLLENAACTKRLLEGTVAGVEQVPHSADAFPWVEVTLTGVRWHVPPSTESRVTVRVPDPVEWNGEKPFARGEPLLVEDLGRDEITYYRGAPANPSLDMETIRGERLRALDKAQERGVTCPSFWVNRNG